MGNAVVHFEVMGRDGASLREFYADLFGWRYELDEQMNYGQIAHSDNYNAQGIGIGGGIMGGMEPGQDGVTFYVSVPDVEATLAKAEDLGGTRVVGPTTIPGGPTFGHLRDPEGHWCALFQSDSAGPAAQIDTSGGGRGAPVVHFEVVGKDMDVLTNFYGTLFGWKVDTDNPVGYGVIARADNLDERGVGIGGGLMGATPEMLQGGNGHTTFYVEVADVGATLAKAEALGGTRAMGPEAVPGGPTLGMFFDPEGHLIGVTQAWR